MKHIFRFIIVLIAVLGFAVQVHAQDLLTYNLRSGMKGDAQVAIMQNFLISKGYLAQGSNTGNFGPLTFRAVRSYQVNKGINNTGFVGPVTRAAMNAEITTGSSGVSYVPGCTSFTGYSPLNGQPCANAQPVTVTPVQISNVTNSSATLASSFTAINSTYYTVRFEYALNPTVFETGTQSRIGQLILTGNTGSFSATMTNLLPNQTYYVRAIVEGGSQGTVISPIAQFTLSSSYIPTTTTQTTYQNTTTAQTGQPLVGTNQASSITDSSAFLSGVYDGRGSATVVYFQYWFGLSSITSTSQVQAGGGAGNASFTLSNLAPGMTYSYRMVATNAYGTVYGSTVTFTTTQPQQSNSGGYVYYGGSPNTCAGSIPNLAASLDASPSGYISVNQSNVPLLGIKIGTDCDASLKSLTFATNPTTLSPALTNYAVYLNGSASALAGSFNGGTFTLTTPIVMNAGTYTKIALKAKTPTSATGTISLGLANVVATSSAGLTNQYPVNVWGNNLTYATAYIGTVPSAGSVNVSGIGGTTNTGTTTGPTGTSGNGLSG